MNVFGFYFSIQYTKEVAVLASLLYCFEGIICCVPLYVLWLPAFLPLVLSNLVMIQLEVVFFIILYLVLLRFLGLWFVIFIKSKFSAIISSIFALPLSSSYRVPITFALGNLTLSLCLLIPYFFSLSFIFNGL